MADYRHTQRGDLMLWSALGTALLGGYFWLTLGDDLSLFVSGSVVFVMVFGFCRLTVEVGGGFVKATLGIGLISKKIPLSEIQGAKAVKNSWLAGWGIRKISGGWMYNVSGFDAVELALNDGGRFRVGTDEAEALAREINGRLAPSLYEPVR